MTPQFDLIAKRQPDFQDGSPDYAVYAGDQRVGRISRQTLPDQRVVWFWGVHGVVTSLEIGEISGQAESFDDAKMKMRAGFERWLAWAMALPPGHLSSDTIDAQLKQISATLRR